jgi:hypothetical protein
MNLPLIIKLYNQPELTVKHPISHTFNNDAQYTRATACFSAVGQGSPHEEIIRVSEHISGLF